MSRLLVTGGAGFIGSALVRQLITETDAEVVNVDALTYAGHLESLAGAEGDPRHVFEHVDVRHRGELDRVFAEYSPDAVLHLAAESHVDRSIDGPMAFMDTNAMGTGHLLEAARAYWDALESDRRRRFRFVHVSTDEVYGDLGAADAAFTEQSPYRPSSPYAASKAAADHLVRAWHRTYGLPVIVSTSSNNYGPFQYPEKLIPLMILNALEGRHLPLYGTGENVRDWIHVDDNARALRRVLEAGEPGRTYQIATGEERPNLEVVERVCSFLDELVPRAAGSYAELIRFVPDRPGHDRRYAMQSARIVEELGWRPRTRFDDGLRQTVRWYLANTAWVESIRAQRAAP